jgi:hypothetical protein
MSAEDGDHEKLVMLKLIRMSLVTSLASGT